MFKEEFHRWVFLVGLGLLLAGLPLSLYLMSVSQLMLSVNWLLEGRFRKKWHSFRAQPEAGIFLLIFLLHVIWLWNTRDFDYALKDLRTKLPLLALPIILATAKPVSRGTLKHLLLVYVAAVLFGSFRSTAIWLTQEVIDVREISVYISHIRFSLNVCMAIFILIWMSLPEGADLRPWKRMAYGIAALWLVGFLFILQSMTGLVVFLLTSVILLLRHASREPSLKLRRLVFLVATVLPLLVLVYIAVLVARFARIDKVDFSRLEKATPRGEMYHHDTLNCQTVNGHYVWIYIADNELRESWNQRSELDYDGLDRQGHQLRDILIRYLTSEGLRKDADGVASLSDDEIDRIESGWANADCDGRNVIKSRICEILWEYRNYRCTGDPSGHSVLMRYEYWKTSVFLIQHHFWTGVGTGDMNVAFQQAYETLDSRLREEWRFRSHNQFLSIFVAFGLFGFLVFLIAFLYPLVKGGKPFSGFLLTAFISIALLSMITEDTIESQAGVTFVALFYCLLRFLREENSSPTKRE